MSRLNRRFTLPLLSFALACAAGLGSSRLIETMMPGFTRAEAAAMIGRRVSNRYGTPSHGLSKCTQSGACAGVRVGERGRVISVIESAGSGFFVVVQWDSPGRGEPMLSYIGRKSRRTFLDEE